MVIWEYLRAFGFGLWEVFVSRWFLVDCFFLWKPARLLKLSFFFRGVDFAA